MKKTVGRKMLARWQSVLFFILHVIGLSKLKIVSAELFVADFSVCFYPTTVTNMTENIYNLSCSENNSLYFLDTLYEMHLLFARTQILNILDGDLRF